MLLTSAYMIGYIRYYVLYWHIEVETKRTPFRRRHFQMNFLEWKWWIPIKISLKSVPQGPINNIPALVQMMAWRPTGDKPLSGLMMVRLLTHICVTRPQWVKRCVCVRGWVGWGLRVLEWGSNKLNKRNRITNIWIFFTQIPPVRYRMVIIPTKNRDISACIIFLQPSSTWLNKPGPLLLAWFNVNPSMVKLLHPLWNIRWNYLSIPKL